MWLGKWHKPPSLWWNCDCTTPRPWTSHADSETWTSLKLSDWQESSSWLILDMQVDLLESEFEVEGVHLISLGHLLGKMFFIIGYVECPEYRDKAKFFTQSTWVASWANKCWYHSRLHIKGVTASSECRSCCGFIGDRNRFEVEWNIGCSIRLLVLLYILMSNRCCGWLWWKHLMDSISKSQCFHHMRGRILLLLISAASKPAADVHCDFSRR